MDRKIFSAYRKAISPIAGYVMTSIILVISGVITYAADKLGFSFFGLKSNVPDELLWALYLSFAIVLFLVLVFLASVINVIFHKDDIKVDGEINERDKPIIANEDKKLFEIPIYITVINKNKRNRTICFAEITNYEPLISADGKAISDIDKQLKIRNLLQKAVPRLQWNKYQYQNLNCEIKILPKEKESIELARIRIQLDECDRLNKPVGHLGFYFCKDKKKPKIIPLGLHKLQISFYYKFEGDNELEKRVFDGYLFAVLNEKEIGWNLETGIRYRMTCDVVTGIGDPLKNKELMRICNGKKAP